MGSNTITTGYPPAKRELLKHGITSDGKYAEQLKKSDYDNADLFICMDENNVRSAKRIFGGDSANKIVKLLSCLGSDGDIETLGTRVIFL